MNSFKITKLKKVDAVKLRTLLFKIFTYLSDRYYPAEIIKNNKEYYSLDLIRDHILGSDKIEAFGCWDDKKLTGFAWVTRFDSGLAYVDWIGVEKFYHRKGIFTKLMKKLEGAAKKWKAHKIYLYTYIKNKPAIEGYIKLGYRIEGVLKNHFWGGNFIVMGKDLRKIKFKGKINKFPDYPVGIRH